MFSSRLPRDLSPTPLACAIERARAGGRVEIDLTESNPTRAGFAYPELSPVFAGLDLTVYEPEPRGLRCARDAVAAEYRRRDLHVPAENVLLTASSSESYGFLMKLLCDPGDVVLVPAPSYPLFDHLAGLEGVVLRQYRLEHVGRWTIDTDDLARLADDRTRAIIVVAPNNPTGSVLDRAELARIANLCVVRGLALIGDEVFADFPVHPPDTAAASVLEEPDALTFALGGLSKSLGMPHMKLGWMVLGGPESLVREARNRLEIIADAFLSVSGPVQRAAAGLLDVGRSVRRQIADRVLLNESIVRAGAAGHPACRVLPVEGGWSAVVRVPSTRTDEEWTVRLIERAGVLVHPGYFFDFARDGYLVVSLLPPPDRVREGVRRLFETIDLG